MAANILQSSPAATTWVVLYTAPAGKVASGVLTVCNVSGAVRSFHAAITSGTGTPSTGNYIKYNEQVDWVQIDKLIVPAGYSLQIWASAVSLAYTWSFFEDNNV